MYVILGGSVQYLGVNTLNCRLCERGGGLGRRWSSNRKKMWIRRSPLGRPSPSSSCARPKRSSSKCEPGKVTRHHLTRTTTAAYFANPLGFYIPEFICSRWVSFIHLLAHPMHGICWLSWFKFFFDYGTLVGQRGWGVLATEQPRKAHYVYCPCMLNLRLTSLDGFSFGVFSFILLCACLELYRFCAPFAFREIFSSSILDYVTSFHFLYIHRLSNFLSYSLHILSASSMLR
jgi:hypothetical protein